MDAEGLQDKGYFFEKIRKKQETNDPNPKQFWSILKEVKNICKVKADHPSWGAKRIKDEIGLQMGETTVRKHLSNFILDIGTGCVFFRSSKVNEQHRRVLSKGELVAKIKKNHAVDHRKSVAVYEMIRKTYFTVTREKVRLFFKQTVECGKCLAAVDLPKTERTRRPFSSLIQTAGGKWV